jgi:hypothetical protein
MQQKYRGNNYTFDSNKSIEKDFPGLNRRPDVIVRDRFGNVVAVGEAARVDGKDKIVKRERLKQQQYQKHCIKSFVETIK